MGEYKLVAKTLGQHGKLRMYPAECLKNNSGQILYIYNTIETKKGRNKSENPQKSSNQNAQNKKTTNNNRQNKHRKKRNKR